MSPEMLPMLPLDVTLQIARKTNVHAGCYRCYACDAPSRGGETRLKSIPALKPEERLLERLGKAGLKYFPAQERRPRSHRLTVSRSHAHRFALLGTGCDGL